MELLTLEVLLVLVLDLVAQKRLAVGREAKTSSTCYEEQRMQYDHNRIIHLRVPFVGPPCFETCPKLLLGAGRLVVTLLVADVSVTVLEEVLPWPPKPSEISSSQP